MNYLDFVKKCKDLDPRNIFAPCAERDTLLPSSIAAFYTNTNPVDVELTYAGSPIRLCSMLEQTQLRAAYPLLQNRFIVALCNGDPFFYEDGKIYVFPHGIKDPAKELLFESFEMFLQALI